jgi:surfeit locus 1 family protein
VSAEPRRDEFHCERGGPDFQVRDDTQAGRRSVVARLALAIFLLLGIVAFFGLGVWQLERRVWKLDLINRVEQRVHAAPVAAPGPAAWPSINAEADAYRRVVVSGRFLNDRETLVEAVTERGGGFWVVTPFKADAGFTVLINRGFVPPERRDPATRSAGEISRRTTVTGLMRMTEPKGAFLRKNDAGANRWYSRDVAAIAKASSILNVAPYFIDADAMPNPGDLPVGGLTVISFYNNHLVYALTWFALALMLIAASIRFAREELRFGAR